MREVIYCSETSGSESCEAPFSYDFLRTDGEWIQTPLVSICHLRPSLTLPRADSKLIWWCFAPLAREKGSNWAPGACSHVWLRYKLDRHWELLVEKITVSSAHRNPFYSHDSMDRLLQEGYKRWLLGILATSERCATCFHWVTQPASHHEIFICYRSFGTPSRSCCSSSDGKQLDSS